MNHTTTALIAAAVRAERERCAAVCRAIADAYPAAYEGSRDAAIDCAAAILARGDSEAVVTFMVSSYSDVSDNVAVRIAILDR